MSCTEYFNISLSGLDDSYSDPFFKLSMLLEEQELEWFSNPSDPGKISIVYLMNDCTESFLTMHHAQITGFCDTNHISFLQAGITRTGERYMLVLKQEDDSVCTFFFSDLTHDVHCFSYAHLGHCWVPGFEYIRQIEYQIAILSDKLKYLGEAYCNEEEIRLSSLLHFPPLNCTCFPSVPEQYRIIPDHPWYFSNDAFHYMKNIVLECKDYSLFLLLLCYRFLPLKVIARFIAHKLTLKKHHAIIQRLKQSIRVASSGYQKRTFSDAEQLHYDALYEKALQKQAELEQQGISTCMIFEEPFQFVRDSISFKIYLLSYKLCNGQLQTTFEEFSHI